MTVKYLIGIGTSIHNTVRYEIQYWAPAPLNDWFHFASITGQPMNEAIERCIGLQEANPHMTLRLVEIANQETENTSLLWNGDTSDDH